jgi:hypothetical protein
MTSESKWTFDTFETIDGSKGASAATGGKLFLKNPDGEGRQYQYIAVGRGAGFDLTDGYLKFMKDKNLGVAPDFFPSAGTVYKLPQFSGEELTEDDFAGVCLIYEAAAGVVGVVGGTVMLLGGSTPKLALLTASAPAAAAGGPTGLALAMGAFALFIGSFKAGIAITSWSAGLQAGVSGCIGYMRMKEAAKVAKPMFGGFRNKCEDPALEN